MKLVTNDVKFEVLETNRNVKIGRKTIWELGKLIATLGVNVKFKKATKSNPEYDRKRKK